MSGRRKALAQHKLAATLVLSVVLLAGLFLRLWVAPAEGYGFDVGTNKGWSFSAAALGAGRSYTKQLKGSMLPNYPPLSMLIFDATGLVYMKTVSPSLDIESPAFHIAIKIPAMIADLLTAILLCLFITRWKKNRWWGIAAAAIYLLHPVPINNSAFWGQTDGIYSLFLVAAFGSLSFGLTLIAGFCMALAMLSKLQAIACFPLFAIIALRSGWKRAGLAVLGAAIATVIVFFPFWQEGFLNEAIGIYHSSIGFYDSVSSAAYNAWWMLYADAAGNMHDTVKLFGFLSFRTIGYILFGLSALFPIVVLWKRLKPAANGATLPAIFYAASLSTLAFFLWNTQMHERYAFAFVPLAFIVAFMSKRAAKLYALISFLILMNLLGWLPATFLDKALYREFPMLDVIVACAMTIMFFFYAAYAFELKRWTPFLAAKKKK